MRTLNQGRRKTKREKFKTTLGGANAFTGSLCLDCFFNHGCSKEAVTLSVIQVNTSAESKDFLLEVHCARRKRKTEIII